MGKPASGYRPIAPGRCTPAIVSISLGSSTGLKTLYIEREGKIGWGEMAYCPGISSSGPRIEVTAQNGIYRKLSLRINHLPDLLLYTAGFSRFAGAFPAGRLFHLGAPGRSSAAARLDSHRRALPGGPWRLAALAPGRAATDRPKRGRHVAVRIWAEHDLIVFPHECVEVGWSVAGSKSLIVNGGNFDHSRLRGETRHCSHDGDRALLEAQSEDGAFYRYSLPMPSLFPASQTRPYFQIWALFGLLLGAMVFIPLIARTLRLGWRSRQAGDFAAVGAFAAFVLLLYLPFGFDSIGHWERVACLCLL